MSSRDRAELTEDALQLSLLTDFDSYLEKDGQMEHLRKRYQATKSSPSALR